MRRVGSGAGLLLAHPGLAQDVETSTRAGNVEQIVRRGGVTIVLQIVEKTGTAVVENDGLVRQPPGADTAIVSPNTGLVENARHEAVLPVRRGVVVIVGAPVPFDVDRQHGREVHHDDRECRGVRGEFSQRFT